MHRVLITFRSDCPEVRHANPEYPVCVVVIRPDGKRMHPTECRSRREARIYANGLCHGAMLCGASADWPVNAEVDARMTED